MSVPTVYGVKDGKVVDGFMGAQVWPLLSFLVLHVVVVKLLLLWLSCCFVLFASAFFALTFLPPPPPTPTPCPWCSVQA